MIPEPDRLLREAVAAHQAGRKADARVGYDKVLAADPDNAWANYFCSVLAEENGEDALALQCLRRSVRGEQPPVAALVALGNKALATRRFDEALAAYRRAEMQRPKMTAAVTGVALALKRLGRLDEAVAAGRRALALRREWTPGQQLPPGELDPADGRQMRRANRVKLAHDAGQVRHLCDKGLLAADMREIADAYDRLAQDPAFALDDTAIVLLDDTALANTRFAYNRLLHLPDLGDPPDEVLSPRTDFAKVDAAFVDTHPAPVVIDDALSPPVLAALQRLCREATIWFEVKDHGGHLGAYFEEGLGCALLNRVADELKRALPRSLGSLSLAQIWAYKHVQGGTGTDYHADVGRVSANLWITPDEDCLEPEAAGLEIWPVKQPDDWDFHKANVDRDGIRALLAGSASKPLDIAHRCNRIVLFDANLFHRTAPGRFAPGYGRQRVNITFLFDA